MIRIEAIPEIFRNSEIIEYPIHNKSEGIEQKFSAYIDSNNTPRSKLKYLPIQWTNYLIKNNEFRFDIPVVSKSICSKLSLRFPSKYLNVFLIFL